MNDLLTVQEVADLLRVDPTAIRRWIIAGILPAVCLPHRAKRQTYRIKREDVEAILKGGQQ